MIDVGGVVSPFNAWLIGRGAITLPLRLRQHLASAQRVAEFLDGHPGVAYGAYPGPDGHPQHELATRVLGERPSARSSRSPSTATPTAEPLRRGPARHHLGGVGRPRRDPDRARRPPRPPASRWPEEFRRYGHLRLSVGLEDPDDLIADLDAALATVRG